MQDIVTAPFGYTQLDRVDSPIRLRLSSTVVKVEHDGPAAGASAVNITYVRQGQTHRVQGKQVVLACYNMMIPYLVPDLPIAQKEALASLVKIPLVYTNVALTNWRAIRKSGVGFVMTPSSFHSYFMVDFPVSLPGYAFSSSPDDPLMLHFSEALIAPGDKRRVRSK